MVSKCQAAYAHQSSQSSLFSIPVHISIRSTAININIAILRAPELSKKSAEVEVSHELHYVLNITSSRHQPPTGTHGKTLTLYFLDTSITCLQSAYSFIYEHTVYVDRYPLDLSIPYSDNSSDYTIRRTTHSSY